MLTCRGWGLPSLRKVSLLETEDSNLKDWSARLLKTYKYGVKVIQRQVGGRENLDGQVGPVPEAAPEFTPAYQSVALYILTCFLVRKLDELGEQREDYLSSVKKLFCGFFFYIFIGTVEGNSNRRHVFVCGRAEGKVLLLLLRLALLVRIECFFFFRRFSLLIFQKSLRTSHFIQQAIFSITSAEVGQLEKVDSLFVFLHVSFYSFACFFLN